MAGVVVADAGVVPLFVFSPRQRFLHLKHLLPSPVQQLVVNVLIGVCLLLQPITPVPPVLALPPFLQVEVCAFL
jgi:hypothetical protein